MTYLLIPVGFILLFFGGDALVRGAVGLARNLGVSPMLIGATIVAYGTTAPELFVSLDAAFKGAPGIAIGNVVGSNICNFLLILGASAVIWPISLERAESMYLTSVILFGSTMLLLVVAWGGSIARWQGSLMVGLLLTLTVYNFSVERRRPAGQDIFTEEAQEFADNAPATIPKSVLVIAVGLAGVIFGADFLVNGAVTLAQQAGIPEEVIGLTMVAFGTSLPELATALIAAWRRHSDVAIGTVFGANIYNILGIMGIVAAVAPVPIPAHMLHFDLWFLLAITLMFGAWIRLLPRITRLSGFGFLVLYAAYILWQYIGP